MSNMKLMHPQEVEVLYILPAIRRELTLEMKQLGLEQKKIAEYICVTEAAVSQYLKSKRASQVQFDEKLLEKIKLSAKKIKDKKSMLKEIQILLRTIRDSGLTCKVHKELADLPDDCVCE